MYHQVRNVIRSEDDILRRPLSRAVFFLSGLQNSSIGAKDVSDRPSVTMIESDYSDLDDGQSDTSLPPIEEP